MPEAFIFLSMNTSSYSKNNTPGLSEIESELVKRLEHPYVWGRKQNDIFDKSTNFIYGIFRFEELISEINKKFRGKPDYKAYMNYALNRWFNFWSARAVEKIFCSLPDVIPAVDSRDRLIDFTIKGISFDHKTSVFPRSYHQPADEAIKNSRELIEWLYKNQSQQRRKHYMNRLYIVLYARDLIHWKLKAKVLWLKSIIEKYVKEFNPDKTYKFEFEPGRETFSGIIWAVEDGFWG